MVRYAVTKSTPAVRPAEADVADTAGVGGGAVVVVEDSVERGAVLVGAVLPRGDEVVVGPGCDDGAGSTSVGRSRRHLHTAFAGPGSGMSPDQAAVTVLLSRRGRLSREAEEVAQGMALGAGESDRSAANSCRLRGPSGPPSGMSLV